MLLLLQDVQRSIAQLPMVKEAALISTCNRHEIYFVTPDANRGIYEVTKYLSEANGVSKSELRESLFKPLWRMWPHDKMLQTVVAEAELVKLLDAKAKSQGFSAANVSGALALNTRRSITYAVDKLRPGHGSASQKQVVPDPIDDPQSK